MVLINNNNNYARALFSPV